MICTWPISAATRYGTISRQFLYTYPGFVTEELATWQEDGEYWRALKIRFPDYITTHTREQIFISVLRDYCEDLGLQPSYRG
jgi:hypothetical protein